jgi:predicted dehydrogenase
VTTTRVGLVGAGRAAENHRAAFAAAGSPVTAVYDVDGARAAAAARRWGARAAESIDALVASGDIDLVVVASPAATHVDVAARALRAGKHVLVEKPVSWDAEKIARLAALSREHEVTCVPGHNSIYVPELARIRSALAAGAFGPLLSLEVTEAYRMPDELAARYAGPLEEVLIHHVYTALHLLGRPVEVAAMATGPLETLPVTPQQVAVLLRWESGVLGRLYQSWAGNDHTDSPDSFRLKVLGADGGAHFSRRSIVGGLEDSGNPVSLLYQEFFDNQARYLLDHLGAGRAPLTSLQDAADAAAVVTAVRAALRDGRLSTPTYVSVDSPTAVDPVPGPPPAATRPDLVTPGPLGKDQR